MSVIDAVRNKKAAKKLIKTSLYMSITINAGIIANLNMVRRFGRLRFDFDFIPLFNYNLPLSCKFDKRHTDSFAVFLLLGQFSVAAGILLIFLIFVMLTAERKRELGIARAIGTQRSQIVRTFTYEGALYGLIAAAIGSVLGIAVGWIMVQIMATAFGEMELKLVHHYSPTSMVIAYTLGVALTMFVVVLSAWWTSHLNIVRAIRDLPEPERTGGRVPGTQGYGH